jgi:hypothetical protein
VLRDRLAPVIRRDEGEDGRGIMHPRDMPPRNPHLTMDSEGPGFQNRHE